MSLLSSSLQRSVFWLFFLNFCLARRGGDSSSSSFASLGRFAVTNPFFSQEERSTGSQRSGSRTNEIRFRNHLGVDLQSLLVADDDDDDDHILHVQPVASVKRRKRKGNDNSFTSSTSDEALMSSEEISFQLSQPLISQHAWDLSTGNEWDNEETVNRLTQAGLQLCSSSATSGFEDYVQWTPHPSTTKLLEEYNDDKEAVLKEGNVLVYVGKIQKDNVVGAGLPMIKTESILPLPAQEMANLLMDSSKVKVYNKMSQGRKDLKIMNPFTKIVRNVTKPPVAKSAMVSVTLMNSRPLQQADHWGNQGFVVVSRAVPGMVEAEYQDMPRNDILMGCNVLEDRGIECFMTAVTHVYSPVLPKMLAKSMGVTSAVNFVRDIRDACQ